MGIFKIIWQSFYVMTIWKKLEKNHEDMVYFLKEDKKNKNIFKFCKEEKYIMDILSLKERMEDKISEEYNLKFNEKRLSYINLHEYGNGNEDWSWVT